MPQRTPQIVAFGGGGFSMEAGNPLLDDYVLSLTGRERPKVCFLPTASGDADHYVVRFYRQFAGSCDASHVSLFRRDRCGQAVEGDIAAHLLAQDVVYVGGRRRGEHARRLAGARDRRARCGAHGARASSCAGRRPARCAGSPRR